MKFTRPIVRSVIAWADQTAYPNDPVSGSPEHSGAHEHLLGLTVEMESDFEPWGKRTRDEEPWARRAPVRDRYRFRERQAR